MWGLQDMEISSTQQLENVYGIQITHGDAYLYSWKKTNDFRLVNPITRKYGFLERVRRDHGIVSTYVSISTQIEVARNQEFSGTNLLFPKACHFTGTLGFMLLALIWKFDFPPFMALIIAILNDGTIMTISKDRVKPSPLPDSWTEIFAIGIILGSYLSKDRVKPSPLPDN
ncbi:unnamed protein product [Lactuca virosa]|uniref:Uncharacterized protein n=1 Tax=Lactuca virosa TaxID=75947 RepID=A0AAU9NAK9_9ASTR|nr:unnamed protein product [Lactuca virosa]